MRLHVPAFLVLFVSACTAIAPTPPAQETPAQAAQRRSEAPKPAYNLTGYPIAVRDGYIDGCESAKGSSYGRKDARRFSSEPQYSMGWNDGFSICSKR